MVLPRVGFEGREEPVRCHYFMRDGGLDDFYGAREVPIQGEDTKAQRRRTGAGDSVDSEFEVVEMWLL